MDAVNRAMTRSLVRSIACTALLACSSLTPVFAQTVPVSSDDTTLKQIIVFGRHGVRSAALPTTTLALFATRPYPDFGVPTGYLTVHGAQDEVLLGTYFHDYLMNQGLLTGETKEDLKRSYFRANSIQRSNISAASLGQGLFPGATIPVHSFALGTPDPIFDPISAKVVTLDAPRAVNEVQGIFNNGSAIAAVDSAEFSLLRSIFLNYPSDWKMVPPPPKGVLDATALPIPLTANTTSAVTANVINTGGLADTLYTADPFVMEYTDGLPMEEVAWGSLTPATLSQQTRIITQDFAIEILPPYLNHLQSSNAAAHVLRSMQQAVRDEQVPGAFSSPKTKLLVINSSDAYVEGLAGLLRLHWLLPGYQPDYCAPGGSLVFELRKSRSTGEDLVRVYYTAQTFDQLRNLTPLTLDNPPATLQLLVPGGSKSSANRDVEFHRFEDLLSSAIDFHDVQDPQTETPPGVLTGVPLQ